MSKKTKYPFVSICTPTFNRRPFIPFMIKCFEHQTYPKDKMEWIIVDDGFDPIEDLVKHIPCVKYYRYDKKMTLGKKRNIMNSKASGWPPIRWRCRIDFLLLIQRATRRKRTRKSSSSILKSHAAKGAWKERKVA